MARSIKSGLDYFPLDVNFLQDRKVRRLMRDHGSLAAAALIAIYTSVYRDKGYYLAWDEDICFDLSEMLNIEAARLQALVADAVELALFDGEMYRQHRIITSAAIQNQYKLCTVKRKSLGIAAEYNLIGDAGTPQSTAATLQSAPETPESATETPQSAPEMQQREREKERKAETEIENQTESRNQTSPLTPSESGGGASEAKEEVISWLAAYNSYTHNYTGLLQRLRELGVRDPDELATILRLSDNGRLETPVWRIISHNNWPRGVVIKSPGRFIISKLTKNGR